MERSTDGKLINFRPALFFALFFALGVFCAYLQNTGGNAVLCLAVSACLVPLSLLLSKKRNMLLVLLLVLLFGTGFYSYSSQIKRFENEDLLSGRYAITGYIVDKKEYTKNTALTVDDLAFGGKRREGKMTLFVGKEVGSKFEICDEIIFNGFVERVEADKEAVQRGYVTDGYAYKASAYSDFEKTGERADVFSKIRVRLKNRLYLGMDEEPAAVAYAILTGDTSGIESGLLERARRGGIAHIFAVSGLHIGALYAFCKLLTDKTGFSRARFSLKWVVTAAVLLFYGGICGFSSSVVRATVMCLVTYAAQGVGVKSDGVERSGLAMLVCLILSPASLFSAGFLLSFGACFGITVFSRTLQDFWSPTLTKLFKGVGKKFGDFLAVSLSAQIFTAPLLLHFFGYVSVWGILLNFLFVPLISAVFSALLTLSFLAAALPVSFATALLFLPSAIFSAVLLILHAFSFTGAAIEEWRVPFAAFVAYYATVCCLSDRVNLPLRRRIFFAVLAFSAFVVVMVGSNG